MAQPSTIKKASASPTKLAKSPLLNVTNRVKTNTNNLTNQYKKSENTINAKRMMNATIEDIAKKYGFDFSRDYAKTQAEAEAQAKRNAFNGSIRENDTIFDETMGRIDSGLREGNTAIDNSFFKSYLEQRQSQANRGINAGIVAEQDLRLGMNQQAEMASMFRDANLARNQEANRYNNEDIRLQEALALVEQERLAQEDRLFQELRAKAFEMLNQERSMGIQIDSNEWKKIQDRISREFNLGNMDMDRISSEAEFTGRYGGAKTVAQLQREFQQRMEEAQLQLEKDKFSWQKQQAAAAAAARAAASRAAASRRRSSSSGGGGGSSSSSSKLASAFKQAQKKSSKSSIDRYYENQDRILTPSKAHKPVKLPGTRITPATDRSLSAWEKMRMMY